MTRRKAAGKGFLKALAKMREQERRAPRDSDRYAEGDETRSGSVPEGDRARAREGIAQPKVLKS